MKRIYVGNLPFSATEDEIRGLFSEHGEVGSVALITDRDTARRWTAAASRSTRRARATIAVGPTTGRAGRRLLRAAGVFRVPAVVSR